MLFSRIFYRSSRAAFSSFKDSDADVSKANATASVVDNSLEFIFHSFHILHIHLQETGYFESQGDAVSMHYHDQCCL